MLRFKGVLQNTPSGVLQNTPSQDVLRSTALGVLQNTPRCVTKQQATLLQYKFTNVAPLFPEKSLMQLILNNFSNFLDCF